MSKQLVDRTVCIAGVPGHLGSYGYVPSLAAGIAFCVLFGISMILHIFSSIRYRVWWQLVFAVGALKELIVWGARIWSSKCPYQKQPFLMQITTLIIGTHVLPEHNVLQRRPSSPQESMSSLADSSTPSAPASRPSPQKHTSTSSAPSMSSLSLVIQAAGGALAFLAFSKGPQGDPNKGTNIMVGGIIFQLASIGVFSALFAWVMAKTFKSHGPALQHRKIQCIIVATIFSVLVIVIRSIYRTVELLEGWGGPLLTMQWYFIVFDGTMMVLAVVAFNLAQPRWAKTGARAKASFQSSEAEEMELRTRGDASKGPF